MASTIGIKIANGRFYPILEEYSAVKKRLILTTVHNKQSSVHIDLYKSTLTDALYIGTLVVENIKAASKGEPSIELIVSSGKDGELSAEVLDMDTSLQHHLNISRKSPPPDFTVDSPPVGLYERVSDKKNLPVSAIMLICLCLILIGFALWFFLFSGFMKTAGRSSVPGSEIEPTAPVIPEPERPAVLPPEKITVPVNPELAPVPETAEKIIPELPAPSAETAGPPVIEAPDSPPPQQTAPKRIRPKPPVASYKVPTTIPRGGVVYKIRWGDTLWDISEAFYRNPWLYPRIVRFNNIRNPDLIISGKTIRIPPKR